VRGMSGARSIATQLLGAHAVLGTTGARNIATRNGRQVGSNAVRTLGLQAHVFFSPRWYVCNLNAKGKAVSVFTDYPAFLVICRILNIVYFIQYPSRNIKSIYR
jgi:hypothetical protein